MRKLRLLLFPILGAAFLILLAGVFLGRRSVGGLVLSTGHPPAPAAETTLPRRESPLPADEGERLDLNTATLEELMTLPGIGQTRAERILAYRAAHGPFASTAELLGVEGIGEGIYSGLRDLVFVEDGNENPDH